MNPDHKQESYDKALKSPFLSPINIALSVFILDQISKLIVLRNIKSPIEVIPGFFNLVIVWNKGAAWGILSKYPLLLTFIASIALLILIIFFKKFSEAKRPLEIAFSILAGGIAGNLFDRLLRGAVLDFLDFHYKNYHWPAFNIADSAITVSVIMLVLISFLETKKQ